MSKFLSLFAMAAVCSVFSAAQAQVALPDAVETSQISTDAFSTGTLSRAEGALPRTLWDGSDAQTLDFLLSEMPSRPSAPSLGEAMKRTLLSPGTAPQASSGSSLGGKKLVALARAGFIDEARTVASLSTASRGDPWVNEASAIGDLLEGDIPSACQRNASLTRGRDELFWVKLRVLCYVQAEERDAADLTLGILRDQAALSEIDDIFLTAAVTNTAPKVPPMVQSALHYAIARRVDIPVMPGLLSAANGGVLAAIAKDASLEPATRIEAAERAIAMGVLEPAILSGIMESVNFDVSEIAAVVQTTASRPRDPLMDALLYQSVRTMNAPEFARDKAQRIALALGASNTFYRAYALSVLYGDDIAALEGITMSPVEAAEFAQARMAIGDSVGAGQWLAAMIGVNDSVAALPEPQAMKFIEQVNLLAVLDPQTAAQIAGAANVSILNGAHAFPAANAHNDPAVIARILEAAFDATAEGKTGQAGLVALAASTGTAPGGDIESVVINQSLRTAGMTELQRRYAFERAWSSKYAAETAEAIEEANAAEAVQEEGGLMPRIKPHGTR